MSDTIRALGEHDKRAIDSVSRAANDAVAGLKDQVHPVTSSLKDQANEAADQAKSTVSAIAGEARSRIASIVDQQKSAGADQVAGVARAAQAAAGDLEQNSPQLARLVKSAADGVDHVAESIRSSDFGDIVASLTEFGRKRPVAFFGGAVLAGFVLARFLKSDAPAV